MVKGLSSNPTRQLAARMAENCEIADPEHKMDSSSTTETARSQGKEGLLLLLMLLSSSQKPHVEVFFTGKLFEKAMERQKMKIWLEVFMIEGNSRDLAEKSLSSSQSFLS